MHIFHSTSPDGFLTLLNSTHFLFSPDLISNQPKNIFLSLYSRFNLSYVSESGEKKRPVIIHRAILGSVERMIAILTENFAGKWPFWLSPRQVMVVPVGPAFDEYAESVRNRLHLAGFMAEADLDAGDTMNKKIRNAQLAQFNFILVVGEKERSSGTVNVRTRDNKVHGEVSVDDLVVKLQKIRDDFTIGEDNF